MMKRCWLVAVLALGACGTKRVNLCNGDTDCKDPMYPFCDVNGEYPASGGDKNSCTVTPDNCPVERCGCTPNAVLSCSGDQVTTCGADGASSTTDTCALGCATDGTRCLTFDPSNGLAGALAMAAGEGDVVIPAGSTIDTDLGTIHDGSGGVVMATSILVDQTDAPSIRVFVGHSFTLDNVHATGSKSLALVAAKDITLRGLLSANAAGGNVAPGSLNSPSQCAGINTQQQMCNTTPCGLGGSGGGNGTTGGEGGAVGAGAAGGAAIPQFVPLSGGCRGGSVLDGSNATLRAGGGGGGGVQFVSLTAINLTSTGLVDVGGGGGGSNAGGGSGGSILLEAPIVSFNGTTTGLSTNGGAGGGCGQGGADAQAGLSPAVAPQCGSVSAGNGGTVGMSADGGHNCTGTCLSGAFYGGGGGAVGKARIVTKSGAFAASGGPLMSAIVTQAALVPQ